MAASPRAEWRAMLPMHLPSDLLARIYLKGSRNKTLSANWTELAELQTQLKPHTLGNSVLAQEIMLVSFHCQLPRLVSNLQQ